MAGTFKFELVSPERVLLSDEASEVLVPGMDGDMTVLPGHAPVITALRPGLLVVKRPSGSLRVYVRGGFAEVEPQRLSILAEHLINVERAEAGDIAAEVRFAEAALAAAKDDEARMMANDALTQLRSLAPGRSAA